MSPQTEPRLSRDRIEALLAKMSGTRVVVLGDAMLDIYLTGDTERLSPEAPVPVVTVQGRRHALGGAANVAANVAAIGGEARLVAVVGDDQRADSLRGELAALRLPDRHLVTAPARPTTSKTRVVARGQQVVRIDEEVDEPISDRTEQLVVAELEHAMQDADALLIEDYNKGVLTPAVITCAMSLARRRGVPVVVDPKFKNFFAYRGATVFKPNRRELEQAMGAALDLAKADALPTSLEKIGVDNLLLTLGAEGMVLVSLNGQIAHIPAVAREVFDVSGAGDTVTAWMGTALAAGAGVREAAQLANYAAGVEVGKAGVATASPQEVLAVHDTYYDQLGRLRRGGLL
ncbi:MAG TPA: PfkB family carbohydrate kinase [Gemmatimonadales bacterium]|nr:PfkB family carbohydrate kinase [Gemmatimonadales bacterium]